MRAGVSCGRGVPDDAPLLVLKFGSSVLGDPGGYARAADEVRAQVVGGNRVLAVVSAMGDTTDRLVEAAGAVASRPPVGLLAQLLATGEDASVALLGLALTARAVHTHVLPARLLGLRTRGPLDDAEPVGADLGALEASLDIHDVVVVPGFVGWGADGAPSVLGRGGSDLTALYLADVLGAREVRLIKDVDGVYPADPNRHDGPLTALRSATWGAVRALGNGVVQDKALFFAEARCLSFRVAALGGRGTWVGGEGGTPEPG